MYCVFSFAAGITAFLLSCSSCLSEQHEITAMLMVSRNITRFLVVISLNIWVAHES